MGFKRHLERVVWNILSFVITWLGVVMTVGGPVLGSFVLYIASYNFSWYNVGFGIMFIFGGFVVGQYLVYIGPKFWHW